MRDSAKTDKRLLRERMRALRSGLSADQIRSISHATCRAAFRLPEIQEAGTVHIYSSIAARQEIDTVPLIALLQSAGKRIVMPVIRDFDAADGMTHHEYRGEEGLTVNRWGVREPAEGAVVPPEELDVVVVPALAVDMRGNRLGFGKGYYDAFLRTTTATSVVLCPSACLVEELPTEPHDIQIDIIITESSIIRPAFT
jgi:5-formyltetrahydrofolate cyclo-ligase